MDVVMRMIDFKVRCVYGCCHGADQYEGAMLHACIVLRRNATLNTRTQYALIQHVHSTRMHAQIFFSTHAPNSVHKTLTTHTCTPVPHPPNKKTCPFAGHESGRASPKLPRRHGTGFIRRGEIRGRNGGLRQMGGRAEGKAGAGRYTMREAVL